MIGPLSQKDPVSWTRELPFDSLKAEFPELVMQACGGVLGMFGFRPCQEVYRDLGRSGHINLHEAPWGHSVWNLYPDACRSLGTDDPAVEKAARSLDFHYISSRYPDAFPSGTAAEHYDRDDAEEALANGVGRSDQVFY